MALGIHHIGIAVDDLDAAIARYARLFGATVEHRETVAEQGVEAASLRVGAVSGRAARAARARTRRSGSSSPSAGPGLHHVAFEVADVAAELERLRADGVRADRRDAPAGHVRPAGRDSFIRRRPAAFWQSSSPMTQPDRIRIEIAFDGQQVLSVLVPQQTADDLDARARRRPGQRVLLRRRGRALHRRRCGGSST